MKFFCGLICKEIVDLAYTMLILSPVLATEIFAAAELKLHSEILNNTCSNWPFSAEKLLLETHPCLLEGPGKTANIKMTPHPFQSNTHPDYNSPVIMRAKQTQATISCRIHFSASSPEEKKWLFSIAFYFIHFLIVAT